MSINKRRSDKIKVEIYCFKIWFDIDDVAFVMKYQNKPKILFIVARQCEQHVFDLSPVESDDIHDLVKKIAIFNEKIASHVVFWRIS